MVLCKYRHGQRESVEISFFHSVDDAPDPNSFVRHCHDGYELIYVARGEGSYVVEGEEYNLHASSLLILPPHAFHHVKIDLSEPYERYVVNFKDFILSEEVKRVLERMFESVEQYGRFYEGDGIPPSVVQAIASMQEVTHLSGAEAVCYLVSLLSTALLRLSVNAPILREQEQTALGARVVRYLNSHLTETISLDALAKSFFVSKFHLCRAFKEHNGVSVLQYLTEKRVMYARHLVEHGETAVCAAAKAGFGDYSSFYRAHRRVYGVAPRSNRNAPVSHCGCGMKGAPLD